MGGSLPFIGLTARRPSSVSNRCQVPGQRKPATMELGDRVELGAVGADGPTRDGSAQASRRGVSH
jgi:hypothetical protein